MSWYSYLEKELSALNDLLADEELLTKKFKALAMQADDMEMKQKYERISEQHQGHFNALYEQLR
ncbi:MAG: hypothetical protein V8R80_08710 [Eubacterium sp.]